MSTKNTMPSYTGVSQGIQAKKQSGEEEKYFTFYHKYVDYVDYLGLSNAEAGLLFRSMFEYKFTGTVPVFENQILTGLFVAIKWDIDHPEEIVVLDEPLYVKNKRKVHG